MDAEHAQGARMLLYGNAEDSWSLPPSTFLLLRLSRKVLLAARRLISAHAFFSRPMPLPLPWFVGQLLLSFLSLLRRTAGFDYG